MVSMSSIILASAAVAATFVQHAAAHTVMLSPKPLFPPGEYDGNSPYARMDSKTLPGTDGIPGHLGVKKIAAAIEASPEKTLRGLVYKYATTKYDVQCGKTLLTGPKYDVPDEIDFPWGHAGPCEAWCDDTKIFANENCQGNKVGKIKVEKSKCTSAKRLQVMYVGVHVEDFEVYGNCVPLKGSGSGGSDTTPSKTPAAPSSAPSKTPAASKTPSVSPTPSKTSTPPKPTTAPAATSTPKPSTPKTNCKRRLR